MSADVASGGSDGSPIQRSVTCTPLSQIGPTIRRSSAPAVAASLQPEFGPSSSACWRRPTRPRLPPRVAGQHRGQRGDDQPRQPRRHVVHHVVEPRAAPAEPQIARRLVADHRVHRADDLEEDESGQAAEHVPEHRAHEAVGEVLAEALDGRAPARRPSMRSVSRPTSALTREARARQVARANRPLDPPDVMQQIAEREQAVEEERVDRATPAPPRLCAASESTTATTPERHRRQPDEEQDAAAVAVEADGAQPLLPSTSASGR